jgi:hypothetical protein
VLDSYSLKFNQLAISVNDPRIALKNPVTHYLLIICLGVLPLGSGYAAAVDHGDTTSASCGGYDIEQSSGHDSCDGEICLSVAGHCSSGYGMPALATQAVEYIPVGVGLNARPLFEHRFNSRFIFTIYRPPIS